MSSERRGLLALIGSVILCAGAHVILRASAADASELIDLVSRPGVWLGLAVYGLGTGLWILSLRGLDLALAYPASALQLVLVYAGAMVFLGESVPPLRMVGAAVILVGIGMLVIERGRRAA